MIFQTGFLLLFNDSYQPLVPQSFLPCAWLLMCPAQPMSNSALCTGQTIILSSATDWSWLHYWTAPCLDKVIPTQTFSDSHLKTRLLTTQVFHDCYYRFVVHMQTAFLCHFHPIFLFWTLRFLSSSTILWFLASCLCIAILCVIFH